MPLKNAKEDLAGTLDSVAGTLTRLEYLAGLLNADGAYLHWGLDRRHTKEAAQAALIEAHEELLAPGSRTPLQELIRQVEWVAPTREFPPCGYVERWVRGADHRVPSRPPAGPRRQLGSALHALRRLTSQSE